MVKCKLSTFKDPYEPWWPPLPQIYTKLVTVLAQVPFEVVLIVGM